MVAYNFQPRFAPDVAAGRKLQTIRAEGRRTHAKAGDRVQLYTGMRTKACRKLAEGTCEVSTYCQISEQGVTTGNYPPTALEEFARADGFDSWADMKGWFEKNARAAVHRSPDPLAARWLTTLSRGTAGAARLANCAARAWIWGR